MKYMLLIYSPEQCWTSDEWHACVEKSSALCLKLAQQGKFISASPLQPISTATSVRVRDGKKCITDGPFAETTEQLGGYYILDVDSLDDAIAVAAELTPATKGTIEIRPMVDLPMTPIPDAQEILTFRDLPFPREQVFAAYSDPGRLARWWGPSGFTNTIQQLDFKAGGDWWLIMHGPDGKNYDNHWVYQTIQKPGLIVMNHVTQPLFRMSIWLHELAVNRTRMIWLMRFETAEIRQAMAKVCVPANEQNFDKLVIELKNS